jgi:hypothetical protein
MSESGRENSLWNNVSEWNDLKLHVSILRVRKWRPTRHLFLQNLYHYNAPEFSKANIIFMDLTIETLLVKKC